MTTIRVAVNGYGVIGKRVADAVRAMPDMELVGVADVANDWRVRTANGHQIPGFVGNEQGGAAMSDAGVRQGGGVGDTHGQVVAGVDTMPPE